MQPTVLNCMIPIAILAAVAVGVAFSTRRWPELWPPSFVGRSLRLQTSLVARAEEARRWVWPAPGAPLDSAQRRLRASRDAAERWAAVPFNRLTLLLAVCAAGGFLFAIAGYARPATGLWARLASPVLAVTASVFLLDLVYRQRVRMLEKERVIADFGSRSNSVALDAARTAMARNWHRDGSLRGASFDHADLRGLVMARAVLRDASLTYTSLVGADLMFGDFVNTRLSSSDLHSANINFSNFENAALGLADLGNASLGRCNLRNAHLEGANLRDAFLGEADLDGAHLEQAIYDSKTEWPDGFVPPEGAINWDLLNDTERNWFRQWRWYVH